MTHTEQEYANIEEELRKFKILQYSPKELEIELNKFILLKMKLEKCTEWVDKQLDSYIYPNERNDLLKFKTLLEDEK